MISVTALGEVLIDFTDAGVSEGGQKLFERNAGGAPANVLVALQRMGFETAFIGKIGNDMHGEFLRGTLTSNGVNCDGLITDPDFFTTLAFVALDEQGDRSFSFARKPGADTQIRPEEIDERIIRNSRIFHIGSLSLTDEPARSATHHALELAKEAGCVLSYDPNYRANLWPNVGAAMEQMRSVLPMMDLVKISDEECGLLTDFDEPEAAAAAIVEQGASVCVVTVGGDGAYVRTAEGGEIVPPFPAGVVDTTGAGDSFWGGFLSAFLESNLEPAKVTLADAKMMVRVGNAVASLCVRKRGGIPAMPTRPEVEALLDAH
ncbi:MAG: carbohydrate kinase [Olegusella sp.]|nr:carbohydrate kinase [Olegusella sp.]